MIGYRYISLVFKSSGHLADCCTGRDFFASKGYQHADESSAANRSSETTDLTGSNNVCTNERAKDADLFESELFLYK